MGLAGFGPQKSAATANRAGLGVPNPYGTGGYRPDPASVLWERQALTTLRRVYQVPEGRWVRVTLAAPSPRIVEWCRAQGVDPLGPDNASTITKRGGLNCHDAWARAFVRAVSRLNKQVEGGAPLEFDIGPKLGGLAPGTRHAFVRARPKRGAIRAVKRKPVRDRIWTDDGGMGSRHSLPEKRPWEQVS
jgi:hypothetical protein